MAKKSPNPEYLPFVTDFIREKGGRTSRIELRDALVRKFGYDARGAAGSINGLLLNRIIRFVPGEDSELQIIELVEQKGGTRTQTQTPSAAVTSSNEIVSRLFIAGHRSLPKTRKYSHRLLVEIQRVIRNVRTVLVSIGRMKVNAPLGGSLNLYIGEECAEGFEKGQVQNYPGPAELTFYPEETEHLSVLGEGELPSYTLDIPTGQIAFLAPTKEKARLPYEVRVPGQTIEFPAVYAVFLADNENFDNATPLIWMWDAKWYLNIEIPGSPTLEGPLYIGLAVTEGEVPSHLRRFMSPRRNKNLKLRAEDFEVWIVAFHLSAGEFISQTAQ